MSKKNTFDHLQNIKKPAKSSESLKFSYFTIRLDSKDANRLKYLFSENGHTIQSAMVEAINKLVEEWREKPIADHGTGRKSSK